MKKKGESIAENFATYKKGVRRLKQLEKELNSLKTKGYKK